jgi:hypothetical protein
MRRTMLLALVLVGLAALQGGSCQVVLDLG